VQEEEGVPPRLIKLSGLTKLREISCGPAEETIPRNRKGCHKDCSP
jgi:hypothetical protein